MDGGRFGLEGYGDFEVVGRGGYSQVYRAHEKATDRLVAIKVLDVEELDKSARRRFERECHATGRLSDHPSIVTLYNAGVSGQGRPFIVMEYYAKGSLAQEVRNSGPLSVERCLHVGVRLASALETAHQQSVLHRDIKPENVLVATFGDEPALADFGIATFAAEGASRTRGSLTPVHAPTEVVQGERASVQSDVYSLGSTLYALLEGRAAFVGEADASIAPILYRIVNDPVPPFGRKDVPRELFEVLVSAMSKSPADRPQTAAELGRMLQGVQRELALPVTPLTTRQIDEAADSPILDAPPPDADSRIAAQRTAPRRAGDPGRARIVADTPDALEDDRSTARTERAVPAGIIAGLVGLVLIGVAIWIALTRDGGSTDEPITLPEPPALDAGEIATSPEVEFELAQLPLSAGPTEEADGEVRLDWTNRHPETASLYLRWSTGSGDGGAERHGLYDPRATGGAQFVETNALDEAMSLGDRETLLVSGLDFGEYTCFQFLLIHDDELLPPAGAGCVPLDVPRDAGEVGGHT